MRYRPISTLAAAVVMLFAVAACSNANKASGDNAYTGTLLQIQDANHNAQEWALGDSTGSRLISVDVSAVSNEAEQLINKRVVATGQVEIQNLDTDSEHPVLVVTGLKQAK